MDKLDKKILKLLTQNARMPLKEIAQNVDLTSPAVSSRIRRMEEQGVIAGYTVVLHPSDSEHQVDALISVAIQPSQRSEFLSMLGTQPEVYQCYHVTGSHSFIAHACCENMQKLEHLITRFQRLGSTSTQIILSTPVDRTANAFGETQ